MIKFMRALRGEQTATGSVAPSLWEQAAHRLETPIALLDVHGKLIAGNQAWQRLAAPTAPDAAQPSRAADPPADPAPGLLPEGWTADQLRDGLQWQARLGGRLYRVQATALFGQGGAAWSLQWLPPADADIEAHLRLRAATDHMTAKLMIAGPDDRIVYVNDALKRMFHRNLEAMRQQYPDFDPETLVGSDIAIFHRDPAHQHHALRNCEGRMAANIVIAGLHMRLDAMPIRDAEGHYLGAFVVWDDVHAIQTVIEAIAAGDLGVRLDPAHYEGGMQRLSELLNIAVERLQGALDQAIALATAQAEGDLTVRTSGGCQGVFGQLHAQLDSSMQSLARMIRELQQSSHAVLATATELRTGSQELNGRCEQQASLLRDATDAMQDVLAGLLDSCRELGNTAAQAARIHQQSREGSQLVGEVAASIDAIAADSKRITACVRQIDDIVFQTNLLAINAAVEAARAGVHGRGFAVVASEIGGLSKHCAEHAKQISRIVNASAEGIGRTQALAGSAAQSLAQISATAADIDTNMTRAAHDAELRQQQVGSVQQQLSGIARVTRDNAVMAEESSTYAETLRELSAELSGRADQFQLP